MTGRRWILSAFSVFIFLLIAWISAALLLNLASTEGLAFDFTFRSRLGANYSPDSVSVPFGVFHFSIVGEALRDRGLLPGDAEDQEENLIVALNSPVPTATARDFKGELPYTPTPTFTYTPTETYTPTSTLTPTPTRTPRPTRTPTRTRTQKPKPTNTPEPTNTPSLTNTPSPTNTPTVTNTPTPVDDQEPGILGGTMVPPPGDLSECAPKIVVTNLHVIDPPISYGMEWVKLNYQVVDYSGLIFSDALALVSGGPIGDGGWDAIYEGEIVFEIDTDWDPPGSGMFQIQLSVKAQDKGGNESTFFLGDYTIPGSCAED